MVERTQIIDAKGLFCPEPIMLLQQALAKCQSGHRVLLEGTDPTMQRDVLHFCHFLSHTLLESRQENGVFSFLIEKA